MYPPPTPLGSPKVIALHDFPMVFTLFDRSNTSLKVAYWFLPHAIIGDRRSVSGYPLVFGNRDRERIGALAAQGREQRLDGLFCLLVRGLDELAL